MNRYCFVMIVSPEIEEKLLDELLTRFSSEIFTSTPTFCHGGSAAEMLAEEQVLGRRRALQVQILATREEVSQLRSMIEQEFSTIGLQYWVMPVLAEGEMP